MELKDLLDNPDYVNANTATRKAIFEKYSKDNADYVNANEDTRQAIHQRFGLGGVDISLPLPEKITDFKTGDFGRMVKQAISEGNKDVAKALPQRSNFLGSALAAGTGSLIKGAGAVGELATDKAKPISELGQAMTEGARQLNAPGAIAGEVGSYILPYNMANKAVQATAGAVPILRGAVNPATLLGSTGEMAASGALVGGLTTPGGYDERMAEAQNQALLGGGANLALRGGIGAYNTGKAFAQGGKNAIDAQFGTPGARTAFTEVGERVYPSSAADPFTKLSPAEQVKQVSSLEGTQVPTSSLFKTYPEKFAYNLAETGPTGGKLIPTQGRPLAEAFGEQTTRNLQKPITDLSGIGGNLAGAIGGALTGSAFAPGIGTLLGAGAGFLAPQIKRGLELWKLAQLKGVANLNPNFAEQLAKAQQTAGRLGLEGAQTKTPLLGYSPRQGGNGGGGGTGGSPTMYVGPTGQATTDLAGTQVNMNPGSMAVPTSAANAAMATTQRLSNTQPKPQPKPQPQPAPSLFEKPVQVAPEVKTNTSQYSSPDEMAAALVAQGIHPYDIKQMVKRQFNVDVKVPEPVIKTPVVQVKPTPIDRSKIPKTTEEIEAENALKNFIDENRGVVTGDPVATRKNFLNVVDETTSNLQKARDENKLLYKDRATAMNEQAGKGSLKGNPKDVITTNDAVRHMINQTSQVGVKQANKTVSISKSAYNDLAEQAGFTLDWDTAPKITGMSVGDARKTMNKWMFDSMDKNVPELALSQRAESMRSQSRKAEKEFKEETITPEQQAVMDARIKNMNTFMKTGKMESTQNPVSGPVIPENATTPPKLTKEQILEMVRNRQQGKK